MNDKQILDSMQADIEQADDDMEKAIKLGHKPFEKGSCFKCEKEATAFIADEGFCNDCVGDMEARAENAFDVARDEGKV